MVFKPYHTFVLFSGCQSQELIGPSPKYQAVLIGENHTLACSKASTVPNMLAWLDDTTREGIMLYLGTCKQSFCAKYDNFGVVSDTLEQLDLVISNIAVEDEGIYVCQIAGTATLQPVTLTVEGKYVINM